jgi:ubiquitin carboxyl-terminal hydrolase 4/11/15
LEPESFLEPELQNLFSLCYYQSPKNLIPLGWNEIDEDKTYPTLASRQPEGSDDGSNHEFAASESGNEEDSSQGNAAFSESTRMNEESDSEDELATSFVRPQVSIYDYSSTFHFCSIFYSN